MRLLLATLCLVAACTSAGPPPAAAPARSQYPGNLSRARPLTRAERTNFNETSRYTDVVVFVDSLRTLGAKIFVGSIGKTVEGRDIPFVVASRPQVTTPREARRLNRPVVYVQANIHAGEVEGKEALLSLLRDLLFNAGPNVLDSLVLIAVPIYNADGNERFGPQQQNRSAQNGPELVGTRANAQGLDLNRDYIKAEAPETRASLAMFAAWEPDVFVDLHTTDGSYHGYALTYAASLNPAARFSVPFTRDTLLVELRQRMRDRQGFQVFDYGNFVSQDSAQLGWFTYDARPRFGTNYYGLRGRVSVLSEAYSHDPFARRVAATYDFVTELLSLAAEYAGEIVDLAREADNRTTGWGNSPGASGPAMPLRSAIASRGSEPVLVAQIERTGDSTRLEAGMPPGVRRTGVVTATRMPVYDRFRPTLTATLPVGYAMAPAVGDSLWLRLAQHGIAVDRLQESAAVSAQGFVVDSARRSARPFQGHTEVQLFGSWASTATRTLPAGTYVVRCGQPLGILAMYLLEPQSDDGFVTWNVLDRAIASGQEFPVVRIVQPLSARLSPVRGPSK